MGVLNAERDNTSPSVYVTVTEEDTTLLLNAYEGTPVRQVELDVCAGSAAT